MEMAGLQHLAKIREYCDYVEQHFTNVQKAWEIICRVLRDDPVIYDDFLFATTEKMIAEHDLSKMSQAEFIPYQRMFYPVGERDSSGFEAAWEHHKRHNPHHWETWTKLPERFPNERACHCVCMVVDWMAMAMTFGDSAEYYYESNKDDIHLPGWAVEYLGEIFAKLRQGMTDGDA